MSLALLFTPQGSQAVGMGRALADASPAARAVFDEADAVLGWPVSALSVRHTPPPAGVMYILQFPGLQVSLIATDVVLPPATYLFGM